MPSKGYQTLGEQLENVGMRLPVSILAQVDAHIDTLRKLAPWAKVGRSDALRDLVQRGLASVSSPQPTPSTQPAIPLALEPAPIAEAQPVPPPGRVNCAVNPNHAPYPATAQECPRCAHNRYARESKARAKEKAQAEQPS
jgi:hypothetical protein